MTVEKIKASFIRVFKRSEKMPDFVLGNLVINVDEFATFVKEGKYITEYKDKDGKVSRQVKMQLLKSKEGDLYFNIDTYVKSESDNPF
jgi:hypothetical protein